MRSVPGVLLSLFLVVSLPGRADPSVAPPPSLAQAAEILLLPGVANTLGTHASRWRSDLSLRNPGPEPIEVRVFFLRTSSTNDLVSAPHHDYFLVAGETREIRNILGSEMSVSGTGALLVMTSRQLFPNNPLGASVSASMRTATPNPFAPGDAGSSVLPAEPTSAVRQLVSAFRHEGVGDKGVRGAVGAVNLSRSSVNIKVEFFDEAGSVLATQDWHLPSLSTIQQMAAVRMSSPGSVRFTRTEGAGSFVAYTTTVDNTTNEATFVYAMPEAGQPAAPVRMNAPELLD